MSRDQEDLAALAAFDALLGLVAAAAAPPRGGAASNLRAAPARSPAMARGPAGGGAAAYLPPRIDPGRLLSRAPLRSADPGPPPPDPTPPPAATLPPAVTLPPSPGPALPPPSGGGSDPGGGDAGPPAAADEGPGGDDPGTDGAGEDDPGTEEGGMDEDLELLDAEVLGVAGDDYLRAHPEIPRGPDGRPLRGLMLPLSSAEQASWREAFREDPPSTAYQGPSYDDLQKRARGTWNQAEQFWVATAEAKHAEIEALKRQAVAETAAILAQLDLNVAHAETDLERAKRKLLEHDSGFFGSLGKLGKYIPWVLGGAAVLGLGSVAAPIVVPLLARRALGGRS